MIRKYQPQDEDAVIHVWLEASVIAHHFIPRSYWEDNAECMRTTYLPQCETHVYQDDVTREITGFISLAGDYLGAIFIAPSCQGQGIGQALMAHAKQLHDQLELQVYAENGQAIAFYRKQGFTIEREQTDEHTGHREFVMVYSRV